MSHRVHTEPRLGLQVKVLSARFLRTWWRSPVNLVVQAAQYLFFAFLIGARAAAPPPPPPPPPPRASPTLPRVEPLAGVGAEWDSW